MVPEDDLGEVAEEDVAPVAAPGLLTVRFNFPGTTHIHRGDLQGVRIEHPDWPGRAIVIDLDGVYLTEGGRFYLVWEWPYRPATNLEVKPS